MDEIGRDHFPEQKRVVVEWAAGATETPIRINLGPLSAELKPNTPTIAPENVALVVAEGHNIAISETPDDYEPAASAQKHEDETATQPGGAEHSSSMKVLDGPGGAPATLTPVNPAMSGGSIGGGQEGQQSDPTDYPATTSGILGGDTAPEESLDAAGDEACDEDTDSEGEDDAEEKETASGDETLAKAKALIGQTIPKIEQSLADQDLATLKAALAAEQGAGPDQERKGAVDALTKAIEQHPDNKTS